MKDLPLRPRLRRGLLLAALTGIVTLGGCGDDPPPATRTGSFDVRAVRACELLTPAEIEAATGRMAAASVDMSEQAARVPMCRWPPAEGPEYDSLVSVLVSPAYYDDFADFVASAREGPLGDVFSEDDVREVSGAGRFGVWMPELGMLQAYGERVMVQIDAEPAAGRDELEAAQALARAALERIR